MSDPNPLIPKTSHHFCERAYEALQPLSASHSLFAGGNASTSGEILTLMGATVGLDVHLDYTTGHVSTRLFRMAAGGVPGPLNLDESVSFPLFLAANAPDLDPTAFERYSPEGGQLAALATALDQQAGDFLQGDLAMFDAAQAHRQSHPPLAPDADKAASVTFPVPDGAPAPGTFAERAAAAFSFLAPLGFHVSGLDSSESEEVVLFLADACGVEVRYTRPRKRLSVRLSQRDPGGAPLGPLDAIGIPLAHVLPFGRPDPSVSDLPAEEQDVPARLAEQAGALGQCAERVFADGSAVISRAAQLASRGLGRD